MILKKEKTMKSINILSQLVEKYNINNEDFNKLRIAIEDDIQNSYEEGYDCKSSEEDSDD